MREQARTDARRMMVQPTGPTVFAFRKSYKSPPRPPVRDVPDIIIPDDQWRV